MGSIQDFKKNKSINKIDVKIIELVDKCKFIVGDENDAMIMIDDKIDEKLLVVGISVRMIKPKYLDDNTLKVNPCFKLVKIRPIESNVKPRKLVKLKELAQSINTTNNIEVLKTFEDIDMNPPNTEADNLIVRVSNISRAMEGKFSKYKLATIKDKNNMQNNIAVYPPHLDSMKPGNIYKLSMVKKTNYKKDDEMYTRLSTVRKANIKEFNDENNIFKNVTTGEYVAVGTILGHGEIHKYEACTVSWMKIRETNKCESHTDKENNCEAKTEFVTEIYFDTEDEVETLNGFSRHFGLDGQVIDEQVIEETMEKIVSKEATIEYNKDKDAEAKKRIVHIKLQ
jgi:hypothetical protein